MQQRLHIVDGTGYTANNEVVLRSPHQTVPMNHRVKPCVRLFDGLQKCSIRFGIRKYGHTDPAAVYRMGVRLVALDACRSWHDAIAYPPKMINTMLDPIHVT